MNAVVNTENKDVARCSRPKPKVGLALGGGVARGWAHIGVLRALKRFGVKPDIVTGCSVGALVGGLCLAGHLQTLEDWTRRLTKLKIIGYLDLRFSNGGLIGGARLLTEMRRYLGDRRIEQLPVPFVAIATDLATGHEVWLRQGPLVEAMSASFALPGVFPPVRIDQRWLADGALVNPTPISPCRAFGADIVIAVNLNADLIGKARRPGASIPTAAGFDLLRMLEEYERCKEHKDGEGAEPPPPPSSALNAFAKRLFRREYEGPSLLGVMVSSFGIITDRITRARLAAEPPDVQIAPRLGHIGLLEFDRAEEMIAEGEAAVERAIPDLSDAFAALSMK